MTFFLKKIVFLCLLPLLFSCASSTNNLESHIGLYKVVKADCKLTKGLFNPCGNIKYLEIVKGQFYGINPDQLALVHWHAEQGSSEIEYTASLISNHKQKSSKENKIWLVNQNTKNASEKVFFTLKAGKIVGYVFQFNLKKIAGKIISRNFQYRLIRIDRKDVKQFKLDYPRD